MQHLGYLVGGPPNVVVSGLKVGYSIAATESDQALGRIIMEVYT